MSCLRNKILRDGTSQKQRFPKFLDPESIKIDDRNPEDWLLFAKKFTEQIAYYNSSNLIEGCWSDFYPDEEEISSIVDYLKAIEEYRVAKEKGESAIEQPVIKEFKPHIALFLTFIELLKYIKEDINKLTKRHLEYYYNEILKLQPKPFESDKVHLIFELAKNIDEFPLEKGTKLKTKKNKEGQEFIYATDKEIVVNKIKIADLRTIYLDQELDSQIYAVPKAKSLDGLGEPFDISPPAWSTFGERKNNTETRMQILKTATVGFAIASPIFLLQQGERQIILTFDFKSYRLNEANLNFLSSEEEFPSDIIDSLSLIKNKAFSSEESFTASLKELLGEAYDYYISFILTETQNPLRHINNEMLENSIQGWMSSHTEWIEPDNIQINKEEAENELVITITIAKDQAPIVAPEHIEDDIELKSESPILKILLNPFAPTFLYNEFRGLLINNITVEVEVIGITNLIIQNKNGLVDINKPFLPFGSDPSAGNSLYFGSKEIFYKNLKELSIDVKWDDLPDISDGFTDYYSEYVPDHYETAPLNSAFTADFSLLYGGKFQTSESNKSQNLFEYDEITIDSVDHTPLRRSIINKDIKIPQPFERYIKNIDFQQYSSGLERGFGCITLNSPDFGHKSYAKIFSQNAIKLALDQNGKLPNPPYTPKLSVFSVNYKASLTIDFENNLSQDQFFHIEPFRAYEVTGNNSYFLPQVTRGCLLIGLKNFHPPQIVNLLFIMLEGSANPDISISQKDIKWFYLSNEEWVQIEDIDIQSDGTMGMQTSGIVSIAIGKKATTSDSIKPAGLHWLKVSIDKDPAGINKTIDILPNAVTAIYLKTQDNSERKEAQITEKSIEKLVEPKAGIKKIHQPMASFGGQYKEDQPLFYRRVSERLRHKNRSVTLWDYERIILEDFPEIYKVKCLNHSNAESEFSCGDIVLTVVPDLKNTNLANSLEPKASLNLREKIETHIGKLSSPWVSITVENPKYERLLAEFKVGLKTGFDGGYYGKVLNTEIQKFLSPWAFEEGEDIVFGGRIYKSNLLSFIESRNYVDYVTDFKLYHLDKSGGIGKMCITPDFSVFPDSYINEVEHFVDPFRVFPENLMEEVEHYAEASTGRSILVSAIQHNVSVVNFGEYICIKSHREGIGYMAIEIDFFVY